MAGKCTYTEKAGAAIQEHLRKGVSWPDACALAEIDESTARGWRTKGQAAEQVTPSSATKLEQRLASFSRGIKKARAEVREEMLQKIKAAGQNWQAAAWFLERHAFEDWGRKERLEHTGKDGDPIKIIDLNPPSPDSKALLAELMPDRQALLAELNFGRNGG